MPVTSCGARGRGRRDQRDEGEGGTKAARGARPGAACQPAGDKVGAPETGRESAPGPMMAGQGPDRPPYKGIARPAASRHPGRTTKAAPDGRGWEGASGPLDARRGRGGGPLAPPATMEDQVVFMNWGEATRSGRRGATRRGRAVWGGCTRGRNFERALTGW